jgi:PQQ-like domain
MPGGGFPLDVLTNVINVHWGGKGWIVVGGYFEGGSDVNGYIFDEDGNVLGTLPVHGIYNGAAGEAGIFNISAAIMSVAVSFDGETVLAGYMQDIRTGEEAPPIQQSDVGDIFWNMTFSGATVWSELSMAEAGPGHVSNPTCISTFKDGFYATYRTDSPPGVQSARLSKFASNGTVLWTKNYSSDVYLICCSANSDGDVAVSINSDPTGGFTNIGYDVDGNQKWSNDMHTAGSGVPLSKAATSDAFALCDFEIVRKVNIKTGETIWQSSVPNVVAVDVALDGSVFCLADDGFQTSVAKLDTDTGGVLYNVSVVDDGESGGAVVSLGAGGLACPGKIVSFVHEFDTKVGDPEGSDFDRAYTVYTLNQADGSPRWKYFYGHLQDGIDSGRVANCIGRN